MTVHTMHLLLNFFKPGIGQLLVGDAAVRRTLPAKDEAARAAVMLPRDHRKLGSAHVLPRLEPSRDCPGRHSYTER